MLGRNENALLAALKSHRDVKRFVRVVDTLPKVPDDKLLKQYIADAPALYVVPGAFTVKDDQLFPTFSVAAIARNVAGNAQARKGDGVDIGVDQLMVLATRALHQQRIGDCSWSLTRGDMVDDELFSVSGLTAMELVFEGSAIEVTPDWSADELDDFTKFHGDIDVPPHVSASEHDKWLQSPPDLSTSAPEAQLDVQLPGASQ